MSEAPINVQAVSPMIFPFRSRSRPNCGNPPFIGRCSPLRQPSGDSLVPPTIRSRIFNSPPLPPTNNGLTTLFENNETFHLRRRASVGDSGLMTSFLPELVGDLDIHETPMHQISKTVLVNGITQLVSSEAIRKTASTIFGSAMRIGSEIINTGFRLAADLMGESESDPPEKEDEVTFKGFTVKTRGNLLTLRAIFFTEPDMVKVKIHMGELRSSPTPEYNDTKLTLIFDPRNIVEVTPPNGSNIANINWDGPDDEKNFILHIQ